MSTLYTCADWVIREGREDEFVDLWTEFVDWSATETDAALGGMLLRDSSDPRRFFSIGPWRSAEEAHEWFRRPDLQERSAPLREVAERFEPRFLELCERRGEVG
jgi:heme-degrading monooxygenase HmoA